MKAPKSPEMPGPEPGESELLESMQAAVEAALEQARDQLARGQETDPFVIPSGLVMVGLELLASLTSPEALAMWLRELARQYEEGAPAELDAAVRADTGAGNGNGGNGGGNGGSNGNGSNGGGAPLGKLPRAGRA
jgi:hypothetical protein